MEASRKSGSIFDYGKTYVVVRLPIFANKNTGQMIERRPQIVDRVAKDQGDLLGKCRYIVQDKPLKSRVGVSFDHEPIWLLSEKAGNFSAQFLYVTLAAFNLEPWAVKRAHWITLQCLDRSEKSETGPMTLGQALAAQCSLMRGTEMPSMTSLTGVAGEHYVLFELLRRGYIAALAPTGVPNADIVVTDIDGSRLCSIQVKTRGVGRDRGWHMQEKHEKALGERHFYCFVDLQVELGMAPNVYVMPSAEVAKVLRITHQNWASTLGKKGQLRNPTRMRRLMPDFTIRDGAGTQYPAGWMSRYLSAWQNLKLDPIDPDRSIPEE
jgi:hypothetical protein